LSARDILKVRDVETFLGAKMAVELPYDPFLYLKAVNEGIPIVTGAPRSLPNGWSSSARLPSARAATRSPRRPRRRSPAVSFAAVAESRAVPTPDRPGWPIANKGLVP